MYLSTMILLNRRYRSSDLCCSVPIFSSSSLRVLKFNSSEFRSDRIYYWHYLCTSLRIL